MLSTKHGVGILDRWIDEDGVAFNASKKYPLLQPHRAHGLQYIGFYFLPGRSQI